MTPGRVRPIASTGIALAARLALFRLRYLMSPQRWSDRAAKPGTGETAGARQVGGEGA